MSFTGLSTELKMVQRRGAGNTVEENSKRLLPNPNCASCRQQAHAGSKTLLQQNLNAGCPV